MGVKLQLLWFFVLVWHQEKVELQKHGQFLSGGRFNSLSGGTNWVGHEVWIHCLCKLYFSIVTALDCHGSQKETFGCCRVLLTYFIALLML